LELLLVGGIVTIVDVICKDEVLRALRDCNRDVSKMSRKYPNQLAEDWKGIGKYQRMTVGPKQGTWEAYWRHQSYY
jgi:hypothetical protein